MLTNAANRLAILNHRKLRDSMLLHCLKHLSNQRLWRDGDQRQLARANLDVIQKSECHLLFTEKPLLLHPLIGEEFRQIALTGITDNKDYDRIFSQPLGNLQCGPGICSSAATTKNALLTPQSSRGIE